MKSLKRLCLFAMFCAATALGLGAYFALTPMSLRISPVEFDILPGMSLAAASRRMSDAGLGFRAWEFSLFGRILNRAADIKAGSYLIERGVTPWQLLEKLTRGDFTQGEVMLQEGLTFAQWRAVLNAHPDLRHDTAASSDVEVLRQLGVEEQSPEGLFFPDTYFFAKQSSDIAVLRRANRAMARHLTEEWNSRSAGLPLQSPYAALILASIVEKETGRSEDRPLVAAVFVNRLRLGMLLQTDPTVIYGLSSSFTGNLTKADLLRDTPYNTYVHPGLPPTPIAMPGLFALRAALHPPASDKLYFVAKGNGASEFSRTLEEHNRAVARYQKRRGGAG